MHRIKWVVSAMGIGHPVVGWSVLLSGVIGVAVALYIGDPSWPMWKTVVYGYLLGAFAGYFPWGGHLLEPGPGDGDDTGAEP